MSYIYIPNFVKNPDEVFKKLWNETAWERHEKFHVENTIQTITMNHIPMGTHCMQELIFQSLYMKK